MPSFLFYVPARLLISHHRPLHIVLSCCLPWLCTSGWWCILACFFYCLPIMNCCHYFLCDSYIYIYIYMLTCLLASCLIVHRSCFSAGYSTLIFLCFVLGFCFLCSNFYDMPSSSLFNLFMAVRSLLCMAMCSCRLWIPLPKVMWQAASCNCVINYPC